MHLKGSLKRPRSFFRLITTNDGLISVLILPLFRSFADSVRLIRARVAE